MFLRGSSITNISLSMLEWFTLAPSMLTLTPTTLLVMVLDSYKASKNQMAPPETTTGKHWVNENDPPQPKHNQQQPEHAGMVHFSSIYVNANSNNPASHGSGQLQGLKGPNGSSRNHHWKTLGERK